MANADSSSNMLWLINQATAGEITGGGVSVRPAREQPRKDEKAEDASFSGFKIDVAG